MSSNPSRSPTIGQVSLPLIFLGTLIIFGLIVRPLWLDASPLPLEVIFILAATFSAIQLAFLGFSWNEIQNSIIGKLSKAMPAFLILFSVGLVIGSWIICGTIPMLVYYGIKIIDPHYIYFFAFLIPIVFSTMTGTSWGSIGTIGIVVMGIAIAANAELCITAGAVVGGAYFGDKMSPLSDTTNMAAIATEVPLYDHIRSMMYTTFPSAVVAAILYLMLGFVFVPEIDLQNQTMSDDTLTGIEEIFHFNILLLVPPAIVLGGSLKKFPTLPILVVSSLVAAITTLIFQPFQMGDIAQSLYKGFDIAMADWTDSVPPQLGELFNRGGLYELSEAVIVAICVFTFIGAIDLIDAMPRVVNHLFRFAKSRAATIVTSLFASSFTNAMTSNQYATSFIVGDAFKDRYDRLGIPRKVLSRSLEDAGTMIESIIPWTPTAVFAMSTLGVVFQDYWHWQLLSLINIPVAIFLAVTGIGCFYREKNGGVKKRNVATK